MSVKRVPIYLQNATKLETDALASALGKSRSKFISEALEFFLESAKGYPLEEVNSMLERSAHVSLYSAWWYRELIENAPVMIWASGLDKGFMFCNKAWIDFSGRPLASLLGNGWAADVHPDDFERCMNVYSNTFDKRECFDIEYRLRRHDGEYRWLIDTAAPHYNDKAEFVGYIGSCIDITPRKLMETSLNLAASSIGVLDDGVLMTDANHYISWVNPAFTSITGYTLEEVKGKKPSMLSSGKHNSEFYDHMHNKLRAGERWQGEIWNRRKSGDVYPEWLSVNSVKDEAGRIVNYVGVFSDITKQIAKEEQSRHLSMHDPLTGLANRNLLDQVLDFAILNSKRTKKGVAILFIDVDGFKLINDTFGHLIGDDVLREVATTITSSIRESDLAARPGGDEFVVILENLSGIDNAMEVASKISTPFRLKIDPTISITFSIGISYYKGDGNADSTLLMRQADMAMYEGKNSGKNTIRIAKESV